MILILLYEANIKKTKIYLVVKLFSVSLSLVNRDKIYKLFFFATNLSNKKLKSY